MHRIIQNKTLVKLSLAALFLVFLATLFSVLRKNNEIQVKHSANAKTDIFIPEKSTVLNYPVSGIIEAKNTVILKAKTSGTITKILKEEGADVYQNQTLIVQEIPLLSAKTNLQNAQNALSILAQKNALTQTESGFKQSLVSLNSAKTGLEIAYETALIQNQNTASLLASQVNASLLTLISTLNFIDEYEAYFPSADLTKFKETVATLYGEEKTYITGKIRYSIKSHENILETIKSLDTKTYPDIKKLIEISEITDKELTATKEILGSAEYRFLDSHTFSTTDTGYTSYISNRASVLETQANLREIMGNARSLATSNQSSILNSKTNYQITDISSKTADDILKNQNNIYNQTKELTNAQIALISEERNLGIMKAPFNGTVKDVFVDYGEFVMPGTPILSIVGAGVQEMQVTVPKTILPLLTVGDAFVVNGEIVGRVNRFAPVLSDGTVSVYITLENNSYINGNSLSGKVEFSIATKDMASIPRNYVHFDTNGAYVVTEDNSKVKVSIIYDSGDTLLVEGNDILSEKLIPSTGINF